jgi:class 3 adenylate cyclase/tetratricopeptide (TPR) repeat protein
MPTVPHHLAAVWFADIVGYSTLAAEDEGEALRQIRAFQASSREATERYGGRVVKFLGDGALAEFASTEAAVRAAVALRGSFARSAMEAGGAERILRIGVHVGDVAATEDGDLYGDGVNVASRLQTAADAGQIVVSEDVRRQLRPRREFRFDPLGERSLKGIATPEAVYAVDVEEEAERPASQGDRAAALAAPESVRGVPASDAAAGFWSRARSARLLPVVALYLVAATIVFLGTKALRDDVGLPGWVSTGALVLLAIGLGIIVATAWVQAQRTAETDAPGKWDLALSQLGRSVTRGELPHLTWGRALLGGAVAFSLLFGAAGLYVVIQDRGRSFSPADAIAEDAATGIAVLPFTTSGPGLDVWREGVIDLVSTNIDGAAGLRAIDSRTVLARWRENVSGTAAPDLETALEIARRTGARYALLGNASALGTDIRLSAEIYDTQTGQPLGQAQVGGAPDSVYALVDRLSIRVLQAIVGEDHGDLPQVSLARVTTASLPALKAFLEGEGHYRRSDFNAAIPAYRRAVDADSTFAMALYRLGDAYGWAENVESELSAVYAERAVRFADRLPEREAILVRATDALGRGTLDGLTPLREAVRTYPDDPELWFQLGDTYVHIGYMDLIDEAEAERAFERVLELDPSFAPAYIHLIDFAFLRSDKARVTQRLNEYDRLSGDTEAYRSYRLAFALAWGDATAKAEARAALDTMAFSALSIAAVALSGPENLPLAAEVLEAMLERRETTPGTAFRAGEVGAARGRIDAALAVLDDPRFRDAEPELLYRIHRHGLPLPAGRLDDALEIGPADSVPGVKPFYAAAYAAEQGRWPDFDRLVARVRADAVRLAGTGDSTGMRFTNGMVSALDGYAAWRRGQPEKAVTLLNVARRSATGFGPRQRVNEAIRAWLADLYLELERPQDAAAVLASMNGYGRPDPFARCSLGDVHAELGERDKARLALESCLLAWKDADPALQPRISEAKRALARL